jgi:hypothetical protein
MRPTSKAYDLPTPRIAVGAKIVGFKLDDYSRYMWARYQVREHAKIAKSLRFQGFLEREPGFPVLSRHCKAAIRTVFTVVDTSYEVEVAGIQADGHHLQLHATNGCYVGGGSSWSGMIFYYQLLFRAKLHNNHVVILQPSGLRLFNESHLIKLVDNG